MILTREAATNLNTIDKILSHTRMNGFLEQVRRCQSRFVSDADYVKKFAVTRSDLLAAWGMGLIIAGVAFFLIRDLRQRFEHIDLFFDRLEARFRYVPFIAPSSALLGIFLILLALVF